MVTELGLGPRFNKCVSVYVHPCSFLTTTAQRRMLNIGGVAVLDVNVSQSVPGRCVICRRDPGGG